ncbi:MAG: threonine/serine exporter family protein [Lachnospiraceae bacterium]|nr:threonine/serine exporter family protein [Lachnospiraceae bacterium]
METEQLLVDTAVLAGEIMQRSGAETYRVEDTMSHIMRKSHATRIETSAFTTMLLVSLQEEGRQPLTVVRRVHKRGMNLDRIVHVNEISRKLCGDSLSLEEAYAELKAIEQESQKLYRPITYQAATLLTVIGFAVFFGGTWLDIIGGGIVGAVLVGINLLGKKLRFNNVFQDISASIGIALMGIILKQYVFWNMNLETVIISGIMPLVPGIAITNAVRDTLMGDYLSGAARILEAFMQAAAVAVGIGVGIVIASALIGEKVLL